MIRTMVWLFTCTLATMASGATFNSDFKNTVDRVWIGADYWANPMEDWSIAEGRLECRGGGNRNVALLTRLVTGEGAFRMAVTCSPLSESRAAGTVGFRIGIRDEVEDYRAAALRGKGLDVGIDTGTNTLFIGKQSDGKLPDSASDTDWTLVLTGTPKGDRVKLVLSCLDSNGKLQNSMDVTVPLDDVRGLVALVNNHKTSGKAAYGFSGWNLSGSGVASHEDRSWGPILWTMHTVSHTLSDDGTVLKLTAQLVPDGRAGRKVATLSLDSLDQPITAKVDPLACTATFRVPKWDAKRASKFTVRYGSASYDGTIRSEPDGRPLRVAGFTGNQDYLFPNSRVARNVAAQDPDVLFFSGDQIYESVGGYGIVRAPTDTADEATIRRATLNYLRKWYLLGWAFGDLMRDRPTICLPDDHDVYQGNVWGQGGMNPHGMNNHAKGGFAQHPAFVNAVVRTQCAHHPDLPDPEPMGQGIDVFFAPMLYGRVSFAVIEDRYFKSGPEDKVNTWKGRPDHVKDVNYDVARLDKPGLQLLGERQEKFLEKWVGDWRGSDFKCVLSQTIFCNLANYHGGGRTFIFADLDSNGWPQTARNNALRIMRKGFAFHYAGDQHLPSITQNGIDTWGDAGFAFCVPSIAAGYPRSWLPDKEGRPVRNRPVGGLPNTGEYRDGLGNYVTVFGVGNPADKNRRGRENTAHDKSSGHGLVVFNSADLTITMECYRVQIDLDKSRPSDQFSGWPKTIKLVDNRGQAIAAHLPPMTAPAGVTRPVLRVSDSDSGELIYALRLGQPNIRPWVYGNGKYTVELGDPDTDQWTVAKVVTEAK